MNTSSESKPDDEILKLRDESQFNTYSLILSALNIPHSFRINRDDGIELHLSQEIKERALYEISTYFDENKNWPTPPPVESTFAPAFKAMSFVIVGILILIYSVTGTWQPESIWFQKGAGNSTAIIEAGEYFRLITPLMLHADLGHLMSNCFLGGVLMHFYFRLTGNGLGLFTMLVTATIANYANVIVHGDDHNFVGFSTAVFSVIGILCTLGYARPSNPFNIKLFMPIMCGLALLAFLGSGGERTDLGAHFFGLFFGIIAGIILRLKKIQTLRKSASIQILLGTVTFVIGWMSWNLAFSN